MTVEIHQLRDHVVVLWVVAGAMKHRKFRTIGAARRYAATLNRA